MAAQIIRLTATINAGQSLSNAVNTGGNYVVGLIMPAAWTNAHVSILISTDNLTFHDLFRFRAGEGTSLGEFKFNVRPGVIVAVDPDSTLMARYIKLRSGTRDEPVPQEAARVFTVITTNAVTVQALPAELRNENEIDSDQVA
jgi:hypothetical protein